MRRTPRTPKYSLMTSVMMNTTGQSITPAVKDSEPALAEQPPVERLDAERVLEREDLDADELGDQRVGDEEARERDEQARLARCDDGGRRACHAPCSRSSGTRLLAPCILPAPIILTGMDQALLDRLESQTAELARTGLFKRERVHRVAAGAGDPPRGRPRGHQPLRQQLPRPRRPPGGRAPPPTPRSTATATAWPRCASSAARRPCTASSSGGCPPFSGTEDTILYSSCFDANGGLFETLLGRAGRRSSPTRSTTRASSTASGSARRSACATTTATWPARGAARRGRGTRARASS